MITKEQILEITADYMRTYSKGNDPRSMINYALNALQDGVWDWPSIERALSEVSVTATTVYHAAVFQVLADHLPALLEEWQRILLNNYDSVEV